MKVLVYARGAVGKNMGSTGVRAYHTARVLAEQLPEASVTLAVPNEPDIPSPHPRLRMVRYRNPLHGLYEMLRHDVIISRNFSPLALVVFFRKRLALDFYSALLVEWLAFAMRIRRPGRRLLWATANRYYVEYQLTLADYVICSNERQRDIWVGSLSTLGLITPQVYDEDRSLEGFVGVVPYGVQAGRPEPGCRVLKGVVPGIRETDKVLIWNGSIMEWFDANTVIRAMAEVAKVRDDVKLFFLGTEHPDYVTGMLFGPPQDALQLSQELGLYERSVFFNVGWVPYHEIGAYLAESHIGVCAASDTLEARYAFRTRYVDLFWAELPIVCTRGDVLAERIESEPLGVAVAAGDVRAFADGILKLLEDEDYYERCRRNMAAVKEELSWERVLQPLVDFCRSSESHAASKRQRFLPLMWRTAKYLVTYGWQRMGKD
ncbi:MAG: glycosyltransferase [Dehalococcoidia bacterium]